MDGLRPIGVRQPFAKVRQRAAERTEQGGRVAARFVETRFMNREAQVPAAILLPHQPGIAAIEQMQLDRIAAQPVERRLSGQPTPQTADGIAALPTGGPAREAATA